MRSGREGGLRRAILPQAMILLGTLAADGAALGSVRFGTGGSDLVRGVAADDDVICGGVGDDFLLGTCRLDLVLGTGEDIMFAGPGDDPVTTVEAPFIHGSRLREPYVDRRGPGEDRVFHQRGVDLVFDGEHENPRQHGGRQRCGR